MIHFSEMIWGGGGGHLIHRKMQVMHMKNKTLLWLNYYFKLTSRSWCRSGGGCCRTGSCGLEVLTVPAMPVVRALTQEVIDLVDAGSVVDAHVGRTLVLVNLAVRSDVPPGDAHARVGVLAEAVHASGLVQAGAAHFHAGVVVDGTVVTLPAVLTDTRCSCIVQRTTFLVVVTSRILTRICILKNIP